MADIMTYKGRPLVRDNNKIYLGEPQNSVITVLTILENKVGATSLIPSRILVQLQSTDPALAMTSDKILKEVERKNLYDALEIGSIWLEKKLSGGEV